MAMERELTITRTFDAPRALVWAMWTDPKHVAQWWGPKAFTNPVCEWDARPGGKIYVVMRANAIIAVIAGRDHPMTGTFNEVSPTDRLVFTTQAVDKDGTAMLESRTTVTLLDRGGKTEMVLHTRAVGLVPKAKQMLMGMKPGWTQSIDRLDALLSRQTANA